MSRRPLFPPRPALLLALLSLLCCGSVRLASGGSFAPLSLAVPPYQSIVHPLPLSPYWAPELLAQTKAVPTCRWWQNIVLQPPNQPVTVSPLSVRIETVDTNKLVPYNRTAEYESCHTDRFGTHCDSWSRWVERALLESPTSKRGANFGLASREASVEMVATFFRPGFAMSAVEPLQQHQVSAWDATSVTVQFKMTGSDSNTLSFPLVRGMPYATGVYKGLTPFLYTQNAILRANDQDNPGPITGSKIKLVMNNQQTVIVYGWNANAGEDEDDEDAEEDELQWTWDRNTVQLVGPGSAQGNWVIRLAFIPSDSASMDSVTLNEQEGVYDFYSGTYPTGGDFDYDFDDIVATTGGVEEPQAGGTLRTSIKFTTASRSDPRKLRSNSSDTSNDGREDDADSPLLMMSLPHHQATFVGAEMVNGLSLATLTGTMVGVAGSGWSMETPAASLDFRAARPVDPERLQALKTQLLVDAQQSATAGETDPYGFGKSISKIGRLALMGEEVGLGDDFVVDLVQLMKQLLAPWLQASNQDALLYDRTYGGIVSTNGVKDQGADFGQGYYNDHHFHYGYIAYGCAVVGHFDSVWLGSYREEVLALVRDYANPSSEDHAFTRLRQFDIFDSHSWAAGLFVFADGRNQESSSEAINAYYAMNLLGQSLQDKNMQDVGRMLTILETQGAKWYWHSTTAQSVYPPVYAANKCVGMVWGDKVVDATWFAAGKAYIHGINMLPFTPASELYLTSDWVREEYPVVLASLAGSDVPDEWRGFIYGTHCVVDAAGAWEQIRGLATFDGGNTRSNLMYFCATRPGRRPRPSHERLATGTIIDIDNNTDLELAIGGSHELDRREASE